MKKRIVVLLLCLVVFVSACSGETQVQVNQAKRNVINDREKVITYAYQQPFKGVFSNVFYTGEDDANVLQFITESVFQVNPNTLETEPYLADWELSTDHTVLTINLKKGIKWHDGVELTIEDLIYAWYLIADPEYPGSRFSNVSMIKGAKEYKQGRSKSIAGIRLINPYKVEVTLTEPKNNVISNIWSTPEPKHYYGDISPKDLENAKQVRQMPIGTGPYKVARIIPGESVELVRNDEYHQGKPGLDRIIYKIVDGTIAQGLLANGEVDLMEAPADQWESIRKLPNIDTAVMPALSYAYIGFKFGKWDSKKNKVVSSNNKFKNKKLRQAMAYALDRESYVKYLKNGLGKVLNTPMPSVSWAKIPDEQINAYEYDIDKAKALLDEVGYIDINGDGYREDPNGERFVIKLDHMSGSETSTVRAQFLIQSWKKIGLLVELNGGGLKELNTFYSAVEKDDPSVEVYAGAWGLSVDPDPTGLWKSDSYWNYLRWSNKKSDELIAKGLQFPKDPNEDVKEYRKEVYYEWQKLINEELPMIFLDQYYSAWAINKRLKNVTLATYGIITTNIWRWTIEE
ncbi:oligopeptide ABC transporter substrate-binding protein [Bacillus massiliigorillae]|uniref:oligopeptide ABC transporter substrate-binding protein n=1 Tax=Bacillus massiliigorillae TaxID=1243664 RepID=UPI0003A5678F|nr:oligopeptide ABC transporter substrate-binding protein [Bacillus massiliigorillae]